MFWPGWVAVSMLTLISIGVLLLVFGSMCAWISGEVRAREVLCVCWFLYVTAGSCGGMVSLLVLLTKTLDGEDCSFALAVTLALSSAFCGSVHASTQFLLPSLR